MKREGGRGGKRGKFEATRKLTGTVEIADGLELKSLSQHNTFSSLVGSFERLAHDVNQQRRKRGKRKIFAVGTSRGNPYAPRSGRFFG